MRVLVTGAAGLYGQHTIEALASSKSISRIYGFDDYSRGFPEEDLVLPYRWGGKVQISKQRFQETTIKELNSLNIDVVVHLAGYNSGKESCNTPEEYFLNNEYGTFKLMQTLTRTKNRPFFIYASTTEVYGEHVYSPIDENHPVNPFNVHGVTKLAAEKHVLAASKGGNYPVTALRFSNTFGENQNIYGYTSVIASFIDRALRNEPLIIYGSGEQMRDFIYIKDAVNALTMVINKQHVAESTVFNIASGKLTSIVELAEKIIKLAGSTSEIIKLPCEKAEQYGAPIVTQLAHKALGWFPEFTLEDGLLHTIAWHKSVRSV